VAARDAVVLGREEASRRGLDPEDVEERAGDEVAVGLLGLALDPEVQGGGVVDEDAVEDGGLVAEVHEHRVRDRGEGGAVVVRRPRVRPRCVQDHEPVGLRDGERAQQDLIHQREDRGVRSDAEGESEDHDERERRRLRERA
jgi:hypothetical protein